MKYRCIARCDNDARNCHVFSSNIFSLFTGGRTGPEIVNWLKKKTGPPATTIEDVDAAASMIEKDEVVVMGFFEVRNVFMLFFKCDFLRKLAF